jgi:plasmid stability protein
MSNFTVAIPDDLLADAKVCAAKAGTSVNSIIRQLLEGYVRNESTPLSGNYEILFKYSLGQIPERTAMKELHLDDEESLSALTIQAGLPLPRLSLEETAVMQKNLGEMIDRFGKVAG